LFTDWATSAICHCHTGKKRKIAISIFNLKLIKNTTQESFSSFCFSSFVRPVMIKRSSDLSVLRVRARDDAER
jgi:hypothetical protein